MHMIVCMHASWQELVPLCVYECMASHHQMTELGIRHQIAGHPSWFEITKGKETYQLEVSLFAHWNVQCVH